MKYIFSLILVILNLVNYPLTLLYMKVQKWYLPLQKEDMVLYIAFAPFYWLLVLVSFIIGWPCEKLAQLVH